MKSEYFSCFNFNQDICEYVSGQCVKCRFPMFSTLVIQIVRVFEREEKEQERDVILIVVKWRCVQNHTNNRMG